MGVSYLEVVNFLSLDLRPVGESRSSTILDDKSIRRTGDSSLMISIFFRELFLLAGTSEVVFLVSSFLELGEAKRSSRSFTIC